MFHVRFFHLLRHYKCSFFSNFFTLESAIVRKAQKCRMAPWTFFEFSTQTNNLKSKKLTILKNRWKTGTKVKNLILRWEVGMLVPSNKKTTIRNVSKKSWKKLDLSVLVEISELNACNSKSRPQSLCWTEKQPFTLRDSKHGDERRMLTKKLPS